MKGAIQKIFQKFGDSFISENSHRLTEQHRKVIWNIQNCGTPAAGWIQLSCSQCRRDHVIERSCGNRMCPTCQSGKTQEWVDKRLSQQLPTHYFLITFTVPEELYPFFIHAPQEGYSALFKAAAEALKKLASNPRFIGVDLPGFFGVLHTWGRTLNFHPHIHFVVPGGGIDKQKRIWRNSRRDFYAPGQALAKVFKGVFSELIDSAGHADCIDPAVWRKNWVVDCEAVGFNRAGVIKYLAPYVFKTAITDNRIISVKNGSVTFSYTKSGSTRKRTMTLAVNEFIRRYLMHVLPGGFMRIRHFGFMGSGCGIDHDELTALVRLAQAFEAEPVKHTPAPGKTLSCPNCGSRMIAACILSPSGNVLVIFQRSHPRRE